MDMNEKVRMMLKLQSALFGALLLVVVGMLAYISDRYVLQLDWTAAGRNSLSEASRSLLSELEGPIEITAYARDDKVVRQAAGDLVDRYRRHKSDIEIKFVNPDRNPDEIRRLGIKTDGELVVRFGGRTAHVGRLSEQSLSNALYRVARPSDRRIVYLKGHGERDLLGPANHDLGSFGTQIENRGFQIIGLNLAESGAIPDNTAALVLSDGAVDPLPGEVEMILEFVARGGNLLWLKDPGARPAMTPLAEALGVEFLPGRVVEPQTRIFGVDDPTMVVATDYGAHASTRNFRLVTVFPGAVAMDAAETHGWEVSPLVRTSKNSRARASAEPGDAAGASTGDAAGPLIIGLALSRPGGGAPDADEQRMVLMGDGDFLSNAYLGNGGNLQFGLNLLNWLSRDEQLIDVPAKTAVDLNFSLTRTQSLVVAFVPLAVLPIGLFAVGFFVWRLRRTR